MKQDELFHEDITSAFRHAVAMMGGFDAVGFDIWPSKSRKAAGCLLSDILNPDRPNKFSLEELAHFLKIARNNGVHLPMHFLCDEVGYSRPNAVEAADQEGEIARQMEAAAKMFQFAVGRLERLQQTETVRTIAARRNVGA